MSGPEGTESPGTGADSIRQAIAAAEPVAAPAPAKRQPRRFDSEGIEAAVEAINRDHALVLTGGRCLVMREATGRDGRIEIEFLAPTDFSLWHARDRYWNGGLQPEGIGTIWLRHRDRRQYAGIAFAPEGAPDTIYNLWRGCDVERKAGDAGKAYPTFRDHLLTNIAGGDAEIARWIFAWFAHMLQRPTERLGVSLVLRGKEGTGKTKIGEVFGALISRHYLLVDDPRYILGQFNAHMANCLLLQADEGFWAGDKQSEGRLKSLVTSRQHMIERKGVDPVPVRNLVRLLVTSNNDWVVPVGMEGRRFAIFDVGDAAMQNAEYFAAIDAEMAAGGLEVLLDDLMRFDLDSVNLRRIPTTGALVEQKTATLEPHAAWWLDRLRHGAPTASHSEWPDVVSCDGHYASYVAFCERLGVRRRHSPEHLSFLMKKLLPDGALLSTRPWINVTDEQGFTSRKRVRCYRLPPLKECRDRWEQMMGSAVDWGEEGDGSG